MSIHAVYASLRRFAKQHGLHFETLMNFKKLLLRCFVCLMLSQMQTMRRTPRSDVGLLRSRHHYSCNADRSDLTRCRIDIASQMQFAMLLPLGDILIHRSPRRRPLFIMLILHGTLHGNQNGKKFPPNSNDNVKDVVNDSGPWVSDLQRPALALDLQLSAVYLDELIPDTPRLRLHDMEISKHLINNMQAKLNSVEVELASANRAIRHQEVNMEMQTNEMQSKCQAMDINRRKLIDQVNALQQHLVVSATSKTSPSWTAAECITKYVANLVQRATAEARKPYFDIPAPVNFIEPLLASPDARSFFTPACYTVRHVITQCYIGTVATFLGWQSGASINSMDDALVAMFFYRVKMHGRLRIRFT